MVKRIGELLSERTSLENSHLQRALRLQQDSGERLGSLLVRLGMVGERDLAEALATQFDLEVAAPEHYPSTPLVDASVSPAFLQSAKAVPLELAPDYVVVAMADPLDRYTLDALRLALGRNVVPMVGVLSEIETAIRNQYGDPRTEATIGEDPFDEQAEQDDIDRLRDLAREAPVIRLVNQIIARALEARASDIHVEPFEDKLKVRYRIDGVLRDMPSPPAGHAAAVISRVKVMSRLNIAERRLPQDGRIKLRIEGREIDMRVSTVPTMHGESVVLRLLDKSSLPLDFESLGFAGAILDSLQELLDRPHGIILVTGPTGSGKTTTLYAALQQLNTSGRKLLTVEDPVEYQLEGINQIQVKPGIGLTFASALRSILRQDPDVIMIGEMRDLETARIAVQSALTGHKVFSTLHTNDAASSVTRLLDMGVEDYLVTSTVDGIVAQRLVRTLCRHCRVAWEPPPELVEELDLTRFAGNQRVVLYRPEGCERCDSTGYRGRTTIAELLPMNEALRQAILQHADAVTIRAAATAAGVATMFDDGLAKVVAGLTTLEEVERVTQDA